MTIILLFLVFSGVDIYGSCASELDYSSIGSTQSPSIRSSISTAINIVDSYTESQLDLSYDNTPTESTTTTSFANESHQPITNEEDSQNDQGGSTTTTNNNTTSPTQPPPSVTPKIPAKCMDDNYCLNGGTCIINESGQMICICPEGYYGDHCETRNICKTVIVDGLTGDQICARIDRECFKTDKYFRCSCHEDEYFVFKTNLKPNSDGSTSRAPNLLNSILASSDQVHVNGHVRGSTETSQNPAFSYLAECRTIDKCLGVRCRQMSEVCDQGECVCNQQVGYLRDPSDGLCKLLDPCLMVNDGDKLPICGQAHCIATYDNELFRCVCPIGYQVVKKDEHRNSTQCVPLTDAICDIPLLNNCQHICEVDESSNKYKCSCLPGYKPGNRPGIDDHLCFFDEHISSLPLGYDYNMNDGQDQNQFIYRAYRLSSAPKPHQNQPNPDKIITYDSMDSTQYPSGRDNFEHGDSIDLNNDASFGRSGPSIHSKKFKSDEIYIRREIRSTNRPKDSNDNTKLSWRDANSPGPDHSGSVSLSKMSAQDRCNMYCEENKICVLDRGSTDSYRCVCDRQGYVSVGDRCLDWCAAAEFSYKVLGLLEMTCWSGVCKSSGPKPSPDTYLKVQHAEGNDSIERLEQESSWRPTFECDCSTSPLLVQDPQTKLCKLDFQSVLSPCLPGNVGYIDCVEHKNAYCAVLHRPTWSFIRDLQAERLAESPINSNPMRNTDFSSTKKSGTTGSKTKPKEKLYTCVCSPEKKFLVDKPRNKARCVDECELLNIECGRFNRMCRAATMAPDEFGRSNLVRMDPDGVRMNFKRTGCECLPGFNVGSSESVDFTLDDNQPTQSAHPNSQINVDSYPPITSLISGNKDDDLDLDQSDSDHLRAKYMNINSRCLLDYDVVEFHASFKAPADFDPSWIKIRNAVKPAPPIVTYEPNKVEVTQNNNPKVDRNNDGANDNHKFVQYSTGEPDQSTHSRASRFCSTTSDGCVLSVPDFMNTDISELHKSIVLVAQCDSALATLSAEAYKECIRYRYWVVQKLRNHFVDWRRVINNHLSGTFELMEGNIRLRVNKCEATLRSVSTVKRTPATDGTSPTSGTIPMVPTYAYLVDPQTQKQVLASTATDFRPFDPIDQHARVDADIDCELTLHSANDESSPRYSRKVLLEKQLQKFIFVQPTEQFGDNYYLMAPDMLIRRESFDQLAEHRKMFNPCKSDYAYCDKQTKCEMVDTVNFTCTCLYGFTPIGSRDIYYADSRKEVCEDINECLFDVCKEIANVSTCINEIGDYRCQCNRHYTGDNKRFCTHVCKTIFCKHGRCRIMDDHHAFCECEDGYKESDCSVQDPNVALRKANMIICGSIFTSVLLLAITFAISLNSQLKKTKRKLKRLEAANETGRIFEYPHQQPFRPRTSKVSSCS